MPSNWSDLASLATIVGAAVSLAALIYAGLQLREIKKSMYATAHKAVTDLLSDERVIKARRTVFRDLRYIPYRQWRPDQEEAADEVCRAYDAAGQMVKNGFLLESYVADHWAHSLELSWSILSDYVYHLRLERNAFETWDDFEYLAKAAAPYRITAPAGTQPKVLQWWDWRR